MKYDSGSFEEPDHNPNQKPSVASCFVTEGFVFSDETSWAPVRVSTLSNTPTVIRTESTLLVDVTQCRE